MSPSVAPVRRSGSIARRNARSRAVVRTRSVSPPILSSLLGNTAAMAIARSPNCCALEPAEAHHGEETLRNGAALGLVHALLAQAVLHVPLDVEPGKQRIVLKYDAAVRPRAFDGNAVEQDLAAIGPFEAGQNVQQRRLPAAARAEQRQKFAWLDVERKPVERDDLGAVGRVTIRLAHGPAFDPPRCAAA